MARALRAPLLLCARWALAYLLRASRARRENHCLLHLGRARIHIPRQRALKNYKSKRRMERAVLEHEKKSKLELWSEGKLYTGKPEPGLFYVSDLAWERKRMLASGRSPKVTLRDMTTVGQLSYQCVQAVDGCTGLCRIREEPPYARECEEWLQNLPLDMQYRGERLPALALNVFLERAAPRAQRSRTSC